MPSPTEALVRSARIRFAIFLSLALLGSLAIVLSVGASEQRGFGSATFPTSTSLPLAITDNSPSGVILNIPVSGAPPGNVVRDLKLNISFDQPAGSGGHTWLGDLDVVLQAPNGKMHTIFSRTGSTTGASAGDSSDAQGPYVFSDELGAGDWWATAISISGGVVPAGTYKTHENGSATPTSIRAGFSGTPPNGTWVLGISDNAGGDTGRVSVLSLTLEVEPSLFIDGFESGNTSAWN